LFGKRIPIFRWGRKRDTGVFGEREAGRYLQRKHGFTIVARNWRNPNNRREEIDLVCREGEVLVFVEVKTRRGGDVLQAYYAVNWKKKRTLRRACRSYLKQLGGREPCYRFDIVTVSPGAHKRETEIHHYRNVSLFS